MQDNLEYRRIKRRIHNTENLGQKDFNRFEGV